MAYNSNAFRKITGMKSQPSENSRQKNQGYGVSSGYNSGAFRSSLGLDISKTESSFADTMNSQKSVPSYRTPGDPELAKRYVHSGLEGMSQDAYMEAIQGYLDGTDMSDSAVRYRQRLNNSNQKRKQNYDDAIAERQKIQQQMSAFELGGRAWDDAEYKRLQNLLDQTDIKISTMEKYGDDRAYIDINNYNRSGSAAADKYSGYSGKYGASAMEAATKASGYDPAKDVLAQYEENKNWAPDISNRPNGEYLMSDFSNQYQQEGTKKHWDMLTDDERNTYYSVMAAEGQDAANKYLEEMQSALNKRFTDSQSYSKEDVQRMYQNTEHDPNWAPDISNRPNGEYLLSDFYDNQQGVLEHVTLNALSVPMSVFGGLPAFIDDTLNTLQGKEIDPYSNAHLAQNFATSIRSSTGEAINEATGAKETDFMTWGDVYQALMSSADSALGATLGGVGYGALMGMGSASSKAKELYDQGATNGQIIAASLAAGAAENVFETLSMELLLKRVVKYGAGGAKDFIKGVLVQGLGEGSEEFFTEISNTITDALFAYDFSEWANDKEAYLQEHPGATDEEILANAIFGTGRRALQAGAAGAISGGFMGGFGTTVGYLDNRRTGINLLNSSPSQLESIIYGASDVMEGYKKAKITDKGYLSGKMEQAAIGKDVADIKAKYDAGTLSVSDAAKLGKVSNVMQEAIMSQDVEKITAAVEDRLREKGVSDTYQGGYEVSTLARAVAKTVAGEKLLSWEKSAIKGSTEAQQVLQELGNAFTADYSVAKYMSNMDEAEATAMAYMDTSVKEAAAKVAEDDYQSPDLKKQYADARDKAKAKVKQDQAEAAEYVTKHDAESGWAGNIGARIVGDGRFSGNSVEGYSHLFGRHQKLFETAYQEGQDATQYTIDFAKAYNAGVNGENLEQLKGSPAVQSLSEVQVTAAYQAGQEAKKAANERNGINDEGTVHLRQSSFWQDGQNTGESAQGVESNAEQNQERNAESGGEEAAAGATGAAEIRTGKVIKTQEELGIKNAKPGVKLTQVGSDFSEDTKKASAMAKQTGVKVIFFTGGYLQLEDGRLARGMKQGDTIYLRADDPNFSASAIAGHESTHVLLDSGRLDRAAVLDALKGKYKAEELNAFAADYFGTDATIDELIDEIICDAMGGMNAFAKSKGKAAFLQEVQGLAEKAIKETGTGVVDSSQKLSSVENDLKEGAKPVDPGEIITDGVYVVSGDSKYSMLSMKSDIAEGVMFRDLLSHGIMNETDITKLKSDLESLLEYMNPNRDILDMNETYGREGRRFSPYKPNSDPLYKISMDFSTLCSKRLLTQYVIEQLQLRENRPMTAKEQMAIRAMLNDYRQQEKALQVACAMCYVEAARLKSPGQMEKWMNDPMSGMKDFFSKKNADFNKRVKDAQAKFKVDHGYAADTAKKGMKASDVTQLNKIGPKMRAEYQMSPEEAAIAERAAQLPRSTYLTAANLANLRDAEPEIYSAYTTFIRNATRSKALETDEPYYYGDSTRDNGNGVVVTDSFIEAVNKENGMRFSSWSDWRIQHMLDYITAVIDNSVRGAAMHGYTKFTQEVRVLGKTGMMFNLSGVPGTQNGLNPDGSLSFSDTESIAVDQTRKSKNDALAMRDMFPETAGIQCIGVSDAHIHALLASDIIDYVIPYHTSGLNAALRRMAGIYGWKDYTNVQNAKIDSSINGDSSIPGWHVEPVFSEFFVGYNTGMTGIEAMRKSAENYINMCRERGMTPKFEAFTGDENYWKLLIDRKMINQKTGKLIQQKPVKPVFDFAEIRKVVDETVENYDSGLESRALAYIVENWDSVGDKIKELEKAKKTAKKTKAVKNIDNLANEMLAAQQKAGPEQKLSSVNETDQQYLEAVKAGDKKTAQRMADEAARKAGYTVLAWHGTARPNITVFNGWRGVSYFTADKRYARAYAANTPEADTLRNASKAKKELATRFLTDATDIPSRFDILDTVAIPEDYDGEAGKYYADGNSDAIYYAVGKTDNGYVDYKVVAGYHTEYVPGANTELSDDQKQKIEGIKQQQKANWEAMAENGRKRDRLFKKLATMDTIADPAEFRREYAEIEAEAGKLSANAEDLANQLNEATPKRDPGYLRVVEGSSTEELSRKQALNDAIANAEGVEKPKVYKVYLKLQNPYISHSIFDGNQFSARFNDGSDQGYTENAIARLNELKAQGYDGIQLPSDAAAMNMDVDDQWYTVTDYVVFSPNQVKSADAATYDENGNVIPLSQRFDTEKDDIRYSSVTNATEYIPTGAERKSFESARMESIAKVKAKFDIVPAKWYVNINDYFYVFENASMSDYTIRYKVSTRNNTDIINQYKEEFRNGIVESTETLDSWFKDYGVQRGYGDWDYDSAGYASHARQNDAMDGRKRYSDRTGDLQQSGGDQGSVPTYLGYTLKDIHAAIRWQKNLIAELDDRRTEAYSALERKEAQRQYELSIDALSTLENYTDILSAKAFRNAMEQYYSGERRYRYSTVNSTQLALENPDVYDEIQVTYDEILQKTKGKDLEAALLEEAQKHREDLQLWEHEAAVLTKLWKQSEKNEAKLAKALSERRDRIAEVSEELRERRRDVRTMENEFVRVVREWEKQTRKLEGKTKESASLNQALKDSIREHRQDNAAWEREYDRLLKMYERNDRQIDRLAADIAHRKEMAAKSVEGRKRTVIRNKILELNKDFQKILDHPGKGDTAHAPRSIIKPLAEFCSMFANAEWGYRGEQLEQAIANGNSQVRIDQISRAQALMAQISKRYEDLASAAGVQGASYQQGTADQIKQATEIMAEMFNYKSIHDMTSDELSVIYKAMKSIMHSIKTANKLTAMETTKTLVETVNHLNRNLDEAIPMSRWPKRFAQRYQMWQMSPHTFWNYICGYAKGNVGQDIDRMFMHGTERMLGVQRDFDNAFNPILNQNEAEIKRMTSTKEKDLVTIGLKDLNGNDVKMTRGMRLSAYMLLNQEDSLRSLAYGGFKLPRMDEYYHGSIASAYGGGDEGSFYTTAQGATISEAAHTLQELKKELRTTTDAEERAQLQASIDAAEDALNNLVEGEEARLNDMREAIWADMTDYEKQLVRAANEWMEHSGNLMQEVYYELNGFDPARVRNYWPIHRDPTTIQSLDTTAVVNEFNLANSGFTKERVRASNPILLTDFFQELLSNKNKMSRYYGFAVAQRDFNKLYKFKAPGSQSSVEQRIAAKFQTGNASFGVTGTQYIENYIKAVSGANTAESTWLSGLYSMAAGSTLSANLRVAISQLASIPTAASVVGWGNAAKGFGTGIGSAFSRSAKDQLANDSVWFYQRYKGEGSTREIADMRQAGGPIAKAMSSKYGKLFFNWCQNMDVLATGPIMWNMARSAVLETGMKETDLEFKQAVQDKYADIIRFSQPNYTETERSDLLRDKRTASKILTMYKTQSNQNLNLLIDASMEMRKMKADYKAGKNGVTEADVKAATAKFANAYTGVLIGGTLAFALMRFIGNVIQRTMNAYRDDDTDEVTAEGIFNGIMKDVLSSVAGMLAGGSIIYDGIYSIASGDRYYGISDSAVGMLSDTSESLVNAFKAAGTDKFPDKAIKALMNAARMAGIPASNVQKLGSAVIGWGKAIATGNAFDDGNATAAQVNARYVNAVLAGDAEKSGAILSQLIADEEAANDYEAEKKVLSTISSYLKPKYQDGSLSKDHTMKVLLQSGMEKADAEAKINSWSGKIETGYTADAIKKAYKAGDVSAEELINYLVKYEGKTKDSARKTELELRCVRETGIEFSSIKSMAVRGLISRDYAVQLLVKYGGKTKEQAQKTVDKYFS